MTARWTAWKQNTGFVYCTRGALEAQATCRGGWWFVEVWCVHDSDHSYAYAHARTKDEARKLAVKMLPRRKR